MEVIFVRSPYFIEVDEASQVESKIELFIWHKGESEPATATYTLSKKAASTTQRKNIYNISNYAKEFIDIINPAIYSYSPSEEENNNWCYVKVKRYYSTTPNNASPTLLDTITYVGANGYTNYVDFYNNSITDTFIPMNLFQQNKVYKYYEGVSFYYPYLTFFIDYINDTDVYSVKYYTLESSPLEEEEVFISAGFNEEEYLFRIPIRPYNGDFIDGCKIEILKNDTVLATYIFKAECEIKYSPIKIDYINKYGAWDFITFFKAKTQNWEVKNKEYQLLSDDVNYNPLRGESKAFNYEAKQSIKLNTGWVDESYNELIKDLMTSETIILFDYETVTQKPVKLKTMTTDLKTSLQDKMINYQIEFEYNYNQINNVI
jgi:hypothetical protein